IPGRDFMMGRTEVTQAQWESIMGNNPSENKGPDLPVENVSWNDCQEFIKKLNAKTGKKFRLPTEEEWEYACRAGGTGDWGKRANGEEGPLDAMGWYGDNSDDHTHPVGQKEPNAFGLYDMHGNVWEWTATAVGAVRVLRGGGYWGNAGDCLASRRDWCYPGYRYGVIGFRLALSQD
ncbi:MAG: formylglycine-generating enzyme family protein, partial [Kiritimatiellia bacterium]